jgi:hypothetical protein
MITNMTINKNASEWKHILDNLDFQRDYFIDFAALLTTLFASLFPSSICTFLISTLANAVLNSD